MDNIDSIKTIEDIHRIYGKEESNLSESIEGKGYIYSFNKYYYDKNNIFYDILILIGTQKYYGANVLINEIEYDKIRIKINDESKILTTNH